MMCVSAAGDVLPPYVVYKAANLWDSWRLGGPKGSPCCSKKCCEKSTRYNRSSSGWFDSVCFTDWFKRTFLPHAITFPGPKALIGDNLSSHFTSEVLTLCKQNDIRFICLPPNATHLCQPLDVSFFGPMKKKWKELLQNWKKQNPKKSSVDKGIFPNLLKKLLEEFGLECMKKNITSGLRTCGIYPLSKEVLLKKLPSVEKSDNDANASTVSETLLQYLKDQRQQNPETTTSRRKLEIVPGRSVSADSPVKSLLPKRKESTSDEGSENEACEPKPSQMDGNRLQIKVGRWVLVKYAGKRKVVYHVGQIVESGVDGPVVKFLKRGIDKTFVWPEKDDYDTVDENSIISVLKEPDCNRRGAMVFSDEYDMLNVQ